ncbi:peptide-methionine (S)-S-oxide reductase [Nonlabens dokdonensis]|uniref:Peptide methionine sulfoxide reductase MsrA n=2 Tax=Nonlabens dokdonensis TaxID=328515 RepID=L7WD46_NONDD|nr:peptide-methionine (S)-S-oxide reductase MsrA [Nonlabens dokdonensis]AGC78182.1 peptide methionine sulfoxide reductase [Nonlabens dokdonensis DSW-6]PZX37925.1 peptide-methionine (S)-S-oxide reductase [Nonlabens dokdonensis]
MKTAILAGGCFWCTEAVFQRVKGVEKVRSGFCGGHIKNPPYREVVQGRTGHAEAIEITYDENLVSFKQLLQVFMATHDPTTLNRQGYDVGTHYRSAILFLNEEQERIARSYVEELENEGAFNDPIVTEIAPATTFYPAEEVHDNYYNNNREQGYCQVIIDPKIRKLLTGFKELVK